MKKILYLYLLLAPFNIWAQTEIDGIMMSKHNLCTGIRFDENQWDNYWEGQFKRDNLNFGNVSTQKVSINGNYGITNNLNLMFSLPFISTKASAGTMKGQQGLQDLSINLKYLALNKSFGKNELGLFAIAGFSMPTSNYSADYMPLNIGLKSKTASIRLLGDFQHGKLFLTPSAAYIHQTNIKIERTAYFTTEMHYTNEVYMPNAAMYSIKSGYRSSRLIAELNFEQWNTRGGFDITSNNMPFPSNKMDFKKIGVYSKYTFGKLPDLSILAGANHIINGRNVGQSTTYFGGFFYVLHFKPKTI